MARGLENTIRSIKDEAKPSLRLATSPIYSKVMLPFILGTFQKDNPDITIALDMGTSDNLVDSVLSMENDVVIAATHKTSKNISMFPLVKEELVAIVPTNHVFSSRESISIREMEGRPLIIREKGSATRNAVLSALESMKIKPSLLIDMKSTEFIKEWVSQGKGKSILIKRAVSADDLKHLKIVPLQEKLALDVSVLFLKSRRYDLAIRKFVHHVEELKSKYVL